MSPSALERVNAALMLSPFSNNSVRLPLTRLIFAFIFVNVTFGYRMFGKPI
jgi:hypothetical protein